MRPQIIFLDGVFTQASAKMKTALTPGVLTGTGVFETMKLEERRVFFWEDHWDRFQRGLRLLRLVSPVSRRKIEAYINALVKHNGLRRAIIRLSVWKADDGMHTALVSRDLPEGLERAQMKGWTAVRYLRPHRKKRHSHLKTLDYFFFQKAAGFAKQNGADEAILCDVLGRVIEGAYTNIFIVKNKKLLTPPVRCGCLNGIMRQQAIAVARTLRISCRMHPFSMQALLRADEIFVTNAAVDLIPIVKINGSTIADGRKGPVTESIFQACRERFKCHAGLRIH